MGKPKWRHDTAGGYRISAELYSEPGDTAPGTAECPGIWQGWGWKLDRPEPYHLRPQYSGRGFQCLQWQRHRELDRPPRGGDACGDRGFQRGGEDRLRR